MNKVICLLAVVALAGCTPERVSDVQAALIVKSCAEAGATARITNTPSASIVECAPPPRLARLL